MTRNHWFIVLAILGIVTAGCMSMQGTSKEDNSPELTKKADGYETMSMFDGFIEQSPQGWNVNGSFCGGGSCRQQLNAANGDTMLVTLTQFSSVPDAKNAFDSIQKGLKQYSPTNVKIADSGYTWHKGNQSESGFLSGQNIGVIDYIHVKGNADDNESVSLATAFSEIVISSL